MADNDEKKTPGVKKRTKNDRQEEQADSNGATEEDGVARAPEAPTTAPNAPKPKQDASSRSRRVVDPTAQSDDEDAADETDETDDANEGDDTEEAPQPTGMQFGDTDATMDDFAAMLDGDGGGGMPTRQRFEIGDAVDGEIVEIGKRYIFVDIGQPDEAMADRALFEDEERQLDMDVGDEHQFYVIGFEDGVQLGPELGSGDNSMEAVERAYQSGAPISGTVTATNKGGFEVRVAGVDAFCPISQIELGYTEEPEVHVGNSYQFQVSEIDDDGRTVVLSRTELLEEERARRREKTLENLEVGQQVDGVVTRVADFGAFVDIGGIEGLVHVSEMSHVYFDNPSEVVSTGDNVTVEILDIEEIDDESNPLRISLSMKEAEDDPWLAVNEQFAVGETVMGNIVRLAPFGAFVELVPGVEGLVHVSEMSRTKHVATPRDVVDVGDTVQVEIQDIDLMNKRISLSMAATEDDPWNDITDRYAPGMNVKGTVANIEDFGVFVDLEDGVTALLPRSEMNLPSEVTPHRKFDRGESIEARVLNIEPERQRMALSLKSAEDIGAGGQPPPEKSKSSGPSSYQDSESSGGSLGTLGDLLKAKKDDD